MEIKDVSYVGLSDSTGGILYALNCDGINEPSLMSAVREEKDQIMIYREQTVFVQRLDSITLVLLCREGSNEIFVQRAVEALVESLARIVKNWCVERVAEKYDQVVMAMNEFVFRGVVLTDESEELSSRVMKRTFENISAIKVNKGFASFLNKATRSLRK